MDSTLLGLCGHLIRRAQQVHTSIWVDECGPEPTSPQYAVMAALAARPGSDQRTLGELASLDTSTVADLLARLESGGWVSRVRDPADRRRNLLSLTTGGRTGLTRVTRASALVQERLLEPVPAASRDELLELLRVVARLPELSVAEPGVAGLAVVGHYIRVAQQVHTSLWAAEFGRGATGPQYAALHVIAHQPHINQRRVGELAALDRSTGADIVRRLQGRGWLIATPDPNDRRGRLLELTAVSREMTTAMWPGVVSVQDALLSPLGGNGRAALLKGLAQIAGVAVQ